MTLLDKGSNFDHQIATKQPQSLLPEQSVTRFVVTPASGQEHADGTSTTRQPSRSSICLAEFSQFARSRHGTVLGYVRDARRFPTRDRFASDNGTAPIEVSGGDRVIYRLSRRGNRQLDHANHMAAVTQISRPGSEGRAYYQRTIAEGMGRKAALRALKRRISYTLHQRMIEDARRHDTRSGKDPGGQPGTTLSPTWPAHTSIDRLFGQPVPRQHQL